jgi:bifunctional non-homologous end joining protein LigD
MPSAVATRNHHPSRASRRKPTTAKSPAAGAVEIPTDAANLELTVAGKNVALTNLQKPFWPELGITKGDLIRYYAQIAGVLLPHLCDRAMVMKRYPHGAAGKFFFMKRAPVPRPDWIQTCSIEHESASVIDFPMIQDLPSLLWVINLGCIDLNPWYARCDDVDRPDYRPLGPQLSAALAGASEPEVRARLQGLIEYARTPAATAGVELDGVIRDPEQRSRLRAIRVLERLGIPAAVDALQRVAAGRAGTLGVAQAREALREM